MRHSQRNIKLQKPAWISGQRAGISTENLQHTKQEDFVFKYRKRDLMF